jgi:CheY-like chemotaxis protein
MSPSLVAGQRYVLLVEDDAFLRELYRTGLQDAGFPVVAVEDGLSALRCVESAQPFAVVLDLELPRLSGLDVQQELHTNPETEHIPIVVITGSHTRTLPPNEVACILRKPVGIDELIAAVQRCLGE